MTKKYNGGLKFGSAAESSGLQRDSFPTHSGVKFGPLNSGSPAKVSDDVMSRIGGGVKGPETQTDKDIEGVRNTISSGVPEKKSSNKPYVKPGGKATGKIGDYAQGSKERTAEYDARGWAHDKTTTGHKDYKKPETIQKTEPTTEKTADPKPEIKGSFRDNYQEGSEKTKRLEGKLQRKDKQTEDAYVEKELAEAHQGKYGKGLFGGYLRRQGAKGKHRRKGRQEDRVREKYNESKAYDAMTPGQRASADATKKADRLRNREKISAMADKAAAAIADKPADYYGGVTAENRIANQEATEANQKIKTKQADLTAAQHNEDRDLMNEGRRLTNEQKKLSIEASNKAKKGDAEVPAAEGTFAANEEGPNMEGTTADKLYKNYSA